jgi:hypothetical protein
MFPEPTHRPKTSCLPIFRNYAHCSFPTPLSHLRRRVANPNIPIAIPLLPDPPSLTPSSPDLRTQRKLSCSVVASLSSHALSPMHAQPVLQVVQTACTLSSIRTFRPLSVARRRRDVCELQTSFLLGERVTGLFLSLCECAPPFFAL